MSTATISEAAQYLSFNLDDEIFAINIGKVREVLEYRSLTKVPRMPEYMRGVINLRGGVVPVIDLKLKFGLGKTEQTINTCVIIGEILFEGETVVLGVMADSVDEVFELRPEDIEAAPRIGTRLNTDFLGGMGKKNEEFILILDLDRVFTDDELKSVAGANIEL